MTTLNSSEPDTPASALRQDLVRLQDAMRRAMRADQPDLERIRVLRRDISTARCRLAKLENEPPPHTD